MLNQIVVFKLYSINILYWYRASLYVLSIYIYICWLFECNSKSLHTNPLSYQGVMFCHAPSAGPSTMLCQARWDPPAPHCFMKICIQWAEPADALLRACCSACFAFAGDVAVEGGNFGVDLPWERGRGTAWEVQLSRYWGLLLLSMYIYIYVYVYI